jgi:hypothetical protein
MMICHKEKTNRWAGLYPCPQEKLDSLLQTRILSQRMASAVFWKGSIAMENVSIDIYPVGFSLPYIWAGRGNPRWEADATRLRYNRLLSMRRSTRKNP